MTLFFIDLENNPSHDSQQNNSQAAEKPIDPSDKPEETIRQESTEIQTAKPLLESLAESSSESSNESDMSEEHTAMRHVLNLYHKNCFI